MTVSLIRASRFGDGSIFEMASTPPVWLQSAEGLAVLVLAVVAIGTLLWELWRGYVRKLGFDARISAHAYALRRQLREWIDEPWPADPAARKQMAKEMACGQAMDRAEERSLRIVTSAHAASGDIADPARRQYVLFYRATLLLNRASVAKPDTENSEYDVETGIQTGVEWPDIVTDGVDEARDLVEECVSVLTDSIDEELRGFEAEVDRRPM